MKSQGLGIQDSQLASAEGLIKLAATRSIAPKEPINGSAAELRLHPIAT